MTRFKWSKAICAALLAVMLLAASVTVCFADTYITVEGYTYKPLTYSTAQIVGYYEDEVGHDLVIPNKVYDRYVVSVKEFAFRDYGITSLSFDKALHLTEIGNYAFFNCDSLTEVTLPPRLKTLGRSVFRGCDNLKTVDFQCNTDTVPNEFFSNCPSLESVKLSSSVSKLETFAFGGCTALQYIELGRNITSIDNFAFSGCDNLTIGCYYNTYAHRFAQEHDIPVVFLDEYDMGDVNLDGTVNITDATDLQKYLATMIELNELQLSFADMNKDGTADISDATAIQRQIAGVL